MLKILIELGPPHQFSLCRCNIVAELVFPKLLGGGFVESQSQQLSGAVLRSCLSPALISIFAINSGQFGPGRYSTAVYHEVREEAKGSQQGDIENAGQNGGGNGRRFCNRLIAQESPGSGKG